MYEQASNTNLTMILNTAIYPVMVALLIALLLRNRHVFASLIIAAGFLTGLYFIHGSLQFPPQQALDYLAPTAVLGGITAALFSHQKWRLPTQIGVFVTLATLTQFMLLHPVLTHQESTVEIATVAFAAVLMTVIYTLMDTNRSSEETSILHRITPAASLTIVAGLSAPVVSIGGSLLIGQLLGVLASVSAFLLFTELVFKRSNEQLSVVILTILMGLLSQAHVLADIPWAVVIGLGLSVLTATLVAKRLLPKSHPLIHIASQVLISGLVMGLSLWAVWPEDSLY